MRRLHKKKLTWRSLVAAPLGLALVLTGCSGQQAAVNSSGSPTDGAVQQVTIRLASTSTITALPIWVAEEQGIFAKNNLTVKHDIITGAQLGQLPSLFDKQYDIGQLTPTVLISAATKGLDVTGVSADYRSTEKDPGVLMIADPKSGITEIKDLVGKRIATPSIAGNVNTGTMYWLQKNGVDPKSVTIVVATPGAMPDLLRAGKIDAAMMLMPFSGEMIGEGYVNLGNTMSALGDNVMMAFWGSSSKWAKNNVSAVKRFKTSIDEAATWMKANPEKAIALQMAKTNMPATFKQYVQIPPYSSDLTGADLEPWLTAMTSVLGFKTTLKMDDLVFQAK